MSDSLIRRLCRRPVTRRNLLRLGATMLVLASAMVCVSVALSPIPDFTSVRASAQSSEAELLDRHGEVLQRLRVARHERVLAWVALDDMSAALPRAVIAAEDQRFAWHPGVDPIGMFSALADNITRTRPRGASTISMQLASILTEGHDGPRAFGDKLLQARDALALEMRWNKREILEAYLNRVSFRGELVGIDAASRGLLAKGPGGLDEADSAVLAALIRAPGASRAAIGRRACAVVRTLHRGSCDDAAYAAATLPTRPYPMRGTDDAPHLAVRLLKTPGEHLTSTLDARLQRFASETLRSRLAELAGRNVEDGAVVVLDNRTGDVLAYVGSSGDLSGAPEVDGVAALRQPGSTLKPFLFGLAIDQDWLTAASILDDSPLALTTPTGLYIPQDYDKDFKGAVTVRTALAGSLNVPSVRALTIVGVDRFLQTLRAFGMTSFSRDADHYGYGLALGGAETTLLSLTNAYRALANGGQWTPTQFVTTAPSQPQQVMGAEAAFIIGDILSDPAARAITFGMASPLSTRTWAAVKTGTSKAMRDNWAVGFTDRYTVGVWVGNFSGAPMWDVSGITGAAPVWRDIVEYLHADVPSHQPSPPPDVVARPISFTPAIEAPRQEWFRAGTEPADASAQRVAVQIGAGRPRLIAPPNGAIVAPDPDIPQRRQSMLIQAASPTPACLKVNGKPLAPCGTHAAMLPLPAPGTHKVQLESPDGKALDEHTFTVRAIARPVAKKE
ncbi:MAG: penicillin-binding protein 1C [Rhodocyclaceae bacterium]